MFLFGVCSETAEQFRAASWSKPGVLWPLPLLERRGDHPKVYFGYFPRYDLGANLIQTVLIECTCFRGFQP